MDEIHFKKSNSSGIYFSTKYEVLGGDQDKSIQAKQATQIVEKMLLVLDFHFSSMLLI
jgi:hypothetical protein